MLLMLAIASPDLFLVISRVHGFEGKTWGARYIQTLLQWDDPQISPSRGFRCVGISRVFQWQLQDASRRSREKPPHYRKLANLTIDWHISSWGFRPVWKAKWKAVGQCWPSFSKFERHMFFCVSYATWYCKLSTPFWDKSMGHVGTHPPCTW